MHHRRTGLRQARAFALGEVNAMGEQAAGAEQPAGGIDVELVLGAGKEPGDGGGLAGAFGQSRLQQRAV